MAQAFLEARRLSQALPHCPLEILQEPCTGAAPTAMKMNSGETAQGSGTQTRDFTIMRGKRPQWLCLSGGLNANNEDTHR